MNLIRSLTLSVVCLVAASTTPSVVFAQRSADVALSACPLLVGPDLAEAGGLIRTLSSVVRSPSDAANATATDRYIAGQLTRSTRSMLLSYPDVEMNSLRDALASDLNRLLRRSRVLFDGGNGLGTFALSPDTQTLLDRHPRGTALVDLNRRILEDRYRGIAQCPHPDISHEGTNDGGGSHDHTGEIVAGVAAIAVLAAVLSNSHHHDNPEKTLNEDGPQVAQYTPSSFAIRGFVQGGWPVYVDYELDQSATVTASIAVDGADTASTTEVDGEAGRHEVRLRAPERFGRETKAGTIVLAMEGSGEGGPAPIHLRVLGVSCGPGAVGSDGIQQARFVEETLSLSSHTPAAYTFGCLFPFQTVVTEIVRISGNVHHTTAVVVHRVKLFNRTAVPLIPQMVGPDDHTVWRGLDQKRRKSIGMHELQVFAWQNSASPKSWSYAASENYLNVVVGP